jgi:predicted restriction endonuclease
MKDNIIEKSFIKIKAMGDYPLLRVTDVRNEQISTANLWERFRLTTMNKELLKPLNDSEQVFNNSEKTNQSIHDL